MDGSDKKSTPQTTTTSLDPPPVFWDQEPPWHLLEKQPPMFKSASEAFAYFMKSPKFFRQIVFEKRMSHFGDITCERCGLLIPHALFHNHDKTCSKVYEDTFDMISEDPKRKRDMGLFSCLFFLVCIFFHFFLQF